MPDPDLLAELDEAAAAAGQECWCGRSPDICEDSGGCAASKHIERLESAIARVRALHTRSERPVITTSLCATHGTRESLLSLRDRAGHDEMRAAAGVCPDCSVTEKYVCTHCRAECPDDDEWLCATIRALEGEQ